MRVRRDQFGSVAGAAAVSLARRLPGVEEGGGPASTAGSVAVPREAAGSGAGSSAGHRGE